MSDSPKPDFVFEGIELLERALHAQLLARRRATFEHDLKNVMHGLLSGTELLGKSLATNTPRITPAECLTLLQQQLTRAQGTLDRMLDEIAPSSEPAGDIRLSDLIDDCTHDLRHQLQRFELVSSVEPRLIVRGSRARLKNALLSVLLDAVDRAAPRSTLTLTMRWEENDIAHMELRHSVTEDRPSAALTYIGEILSADEGHLDVSTEPGARTIVIRFPTVAPARIDANSRRLVIVDANRDAADSLAMLVQLEGFEAEAVYDVEAAVKSARAQPTLAVVLDVDGSIDANGAITRLRAESSATVRIIGMSHTEEPRIANVDAQLRKPLDPAALRSVLQPIGGKA